MTDADGAIYIYLDGGGFGRLHESKRQEKDTVADLSDPKYGKFYDVTANMRPAAAADDLVRKPDKKQRKVTVRLQDEDVIPGNAKHETVLRIYPEECYEVFYATGHSGPDGIPVRNHELISGRALADSIHEGVYLSAMAKTRSPMLAKDAADVAVPEEGSEEALRCADEFAGRKHVASPISDERYQELHGHLADQARDIVHESDSIQAKLNQAAHPALSDEEKAGVVSDARVAAGVELAPDNGIRVNAAAVRPATDEETRDIRRQLSLQKQAAISRRAENVSPCNTAVSVTMFGRRDSKNAVSATIYVDSQAVTPLENGMCDVRLDGPGSFGKNYAVRLGDSEQVYTYGAHNIIDRFCDSGAQKSVPQGEDRGMDGASEDRYARRNECVLHNITMTDPGDEQFHQLWQDTKHGGWTLSFGLRDEDPNVRFRTHVEDSQIIDKKDKTFESKAHKVDVVLPADAFLDVCRRNPGETHFRVIGKMSVMEAAKRRDAELAGFRSARRKARTDNIKQQTQEQDVKDITD